MHSLLRRPSTWVVLGAGLLAADPLRWLIGTWTDATYNPEGLAVAAVVVLLALWSFTSPLRYGAPDSGRAIGLLAVSAGVRAAGQLLGVNVLAALTLAVDVYALASIAGLSQRRRAVSPFWLSALFMLSLPLERVLQRAVGYGLQQLSAAGACSALGVLDFEVACKGTRILMDGQDLLVDLPCSGARGLTLLLTLYCALAAFARPDVFTAVRGFLVTLASAWASNVLRIVLLAIGLARHAPVMEAPWHEAIGLATLALGAWPVIRWARRARNEVRGVWIPVADAPLCDRRLPPRFSRHLSALFLLGAVAIVNLPTRPVDVAKAIAPPQLPGALGEWTANPQPLSRAEQAYYTRYGGGAARAAYGEHALLLVRTSAPLRHLHAPDECLRNAGMSVRYMGVTRGAHPTATYRAEDERGLRWRVSVSYVADDGAWAASVSEAVWRWFDSRSSWTLVERISPWNENPADTLAFDASVVRALDLPPAPESREPSFNRMPGAPADTFI